MNKDETGSPQLLIGINPRRRTCAAPCGTSGTAKDECVRTVPPRENGGNLDTKETVVGTTLLFPCFIDGCGLFAGDVHYAQGGARSAAPLSRWAPR